MFDPPLVVCCWLPVLLFIIYLIRVRRSSIADMRKLDTTLRRLGPIVVVDVGSYVTGLEASVSSFGTRCAVFKGEFIFLNHVGSELGRIPTNAINRIAVEDRSQVTQKVSTNPITSLTSSNKERVHDYYLVIDWDGGHGLKESTVFAFGAAGGNAANYASHQLKQYVQPKKERLRPSEKRCPYCAEVIKAEAKICRFCRSRVA